MNANFKQFVLPRTKTTVYYPEFLSQDEYEAIQSILTKNAKVVDGQTDFELSQVTVYLKSLVLKQVYLKSENVAPSPDAPGGEHYSPVTEDWYGRQPHTDIKVLWELLQNEYELNKPAGDAEGGKK